MKPLFTRRALPRSCATFRCSCSSSWVEVFLIFICSCKKKIDHPYPHVTMNCTRVGSHFATTSLRIKWLERKQCGHRFQEIAGIERLKYFRSLHYYHHQVHHMLHKEMQIASIEFWDIENVLYGFAIDIIIATYCSKEFAFAEEFIFLFLPFCKNLGDYINCIWNW